jgi:hypothetical protein
MLSLWPGCDAGVTLSKENWIKLRSIIIKQLNVKEKLKNIFNKKKSKSTRVNLLPWTQDWDNLKKKFEKKKHEDQFLINQILKDEIEIKIIFLKKSKSTRVNIRKSWHWLHCALKRSKDQNVLNQSHNS